MRYSIATYKDRLFCLALSLGVGGLFAKGFIATSQKLYSLTSPWIPPAPAPWGDLKAMSFFPLLAGLFALSLPKRRAETSWGSSGFPWRISFLPLLIAFAFGRVLSHDWNWSFKTNTVDTLWYLFFIPFGEECLFRGWFYGVLDRLWPQTAFTGTNPLPVAVWGSAFAFSVWHSQNFSTTPDALVVFQIFYTLITGLWLGVLRHRTAQIWPAILAHGLVNFVAGT